MLSKQALDLLYKLYRQKCFRKGHIPITTLLRPYRRGDMLLYKRAVKELKQSRLVVIFPHGSEHHIQINVNHIKEVIQIIESKFDLDEWSS